MQVRLRHTAARQFTPFVSIQYKLCILVHRFLNGAAPQYLTELVQPLSDVVSRRRLRSASMAEVLVPATHVVQPLVTAPSPVSSLEQSACRSAIHQDLFCFKRHLKHHFKKKFVSNETFLPLHFLTI